MNIHIKDLVIKGVHGLTEKEQTSPQRFCFNLTINCNEPKKFDDNINKTLDYREAKNIIEEIVKGPRQNLLETIGDIISTRIMENKKVNSLNILIQKLDIWDNGIPGIEINRTRYG